MILIVNEGDKPVRQQLYVLDSARLFGNANAIRLPHLVDRWDMDPLPKDIKLRVGTTASVLVMTGTSEETNNKKAVAAPKALQ